MIAVDMPWLRQWTDDTFNHSFVARPSLTIVNFTSLMHAALAEICSLQDVYYYPNEPITIVTFLCVMLRCVFSEKLAAWHVALEIQFSRWKLSVENVNT